MNLSEALDAALPEIPRAQLTRSRPPRLDPDLIVHEDVLDGEPIIGILQRDRSNYFRFQPSQWQLAQLFDGNRSYAEIVDAFASQTGLSIDPEEVRSFAEQMDASDFWHKTHQEKNLAMSEKLIAQRGRRGKSKVNLAHISFSAWDPDRYLGWLNRKAGAFIYSPWCALVAVLLFVFETVVVVENWRIIVPDTALFFNFTQKSFSDFAQFWLLMLVIGFLHESSHGLTCKHFGGQVHSMGLMFLYLAPCFFVDVTESWVSATKVQRLATIIAGIWVELMICGMAMIFWLNTPVGGSLHNFMYEIILLTGIAAVIINLNPLIKLDGYYFLTEVIEIPELKERSTAFLSGWFQAKILRLPVEVPIVPRRRAALFVIYAFLSGAYSYILLFFVVRISYRLGSKWFAEFALIPSGVLAFAVYRSRLRSLRRVIAQFWQQNFSAGFHGRPSYILAAILAVALLFLPLWRDREDAFFVIEPTLEHSVCASVPGRVNAVLVEEGQKVRAGQPLLRMSSYLAASMDSAAVAQTRSARFRAFDAQVQGQGIGTAAAEQSQATRMTGLAKEAQSSLELTAPADGTVLTANPAVLIDQDVAYGQPLLDLAGGSRTIRVFIPSSALSRIPKNAAVELAIPGQFTHLGVTLPPPSGEQVTLPPGLIPIEKFQGIKLPVFYSARISLPQTAGNPMFGLSGQAKIFGVRRSLAGRFLAMMTDLVKAHVW